MAKDVFQIYKKAVRAKYEKVKTEKYAAFLQQPSPAELKNYCLMLFENGLNSQDELVFRVFFQAKEDQNLRLAIEQFGTGKIKSTQLFLTGGNTENRRMIELIAIMVDYTPRPFPKFLKEYDSGKVVLEEENEDGRTRTKSTSGKDSTPMSDDTPPGSNRKWAIVALILLFLFFAGYTTKDILFAKKECMQWQNNHYEPMDCNVDGLVSGSDIEPFDPKKSDLKKIKITNETVFFRNGIPLVWYIKQGNKCEFYNEPGVHPVTGRQLRPVSSLIINKYAIGNKN
jgi:hypothetical protein